MKKLAVLAVVVLLCCAATCSPLFVYYKVDQKGTDITKGFTIHQLKINVTPTHNHYTNGNLLWINTRIKNLTAAPVKINSNLLKLYSDPMKFKRIQTDVGNDFATRRIFYKNDSFIQVILLPNDSVLISNAFNNDFHGSFKKFTPVLKKNRAFIKLDGIFVNDKLLDIDSIKIEVDDNHKENTF